MRGARRFLFGQDLLAEPVSDSPDPCAGAAAAAYQRGIEEGRAAASAETERLIATALDSIAAGLAAGLGRMEEAEAAIETEALRFYEILARTLAGQALADQPFGPLAEAAATAFRHLRGVPHLAVRVPAELVEQADSLLARTARERGFEGRIIVLGEDNLAPGEARFEWADGGVVGDRAALDAAVASALAAAAPVRETDRTS